MRREADQIGIRDNLVQRQLARRLYGVAVQHAAKRAHHHA